MYLHGPDSHRVYYPAYPGALAPDPGRMSKRYCRACCSFAPCTTTVQCTREWKFVSPGTQPHHSGPVFCSGTLRFTGYPTLLVLLWRPYLRGLVRWMKQYSTQSKHSLMHFGTCWKVVSSILVESGEQDPEDGLKVTQCGVEEGTTPLILLEELSSITNVLRVRGWRALTAKMVQLHGKWDAVTGTVE